MAITQTHSRMVSDVDAGSTYATTTALAAKADTSSLGTASALNVGTSASNVVQLDGSAKLPAVDGSALTNVSSGGAWRYLATVTAATSAIPRALRRRRRRRLRTLLRLRRRPSRRSS